MNSKDLFIKRLANLLSIKSIVTIIMTVILAVMLLGNYDPPKELLSLYCTSYGAVLAFYFSKPDNNNKEE